MRFALARRIVCSVTLALAVMASAAAAAPVTGKMSIGGRAIAIRDVSAVRLTGGGEGDPAWQLVFSEQPHDHTAEGQARALDGKHGQGFAVEVLANGEGHLFVLYVPGPDGTGAYPSSFPWPQVSGFAARDGRVRGTLRNNPDFPYKDIVFDLAFDAPIVNP